MTLSRQMKSYFFPLLLVLSIILGGVTGYVLGDSAVLLKPLGEIFLNLIFTTIVPLIFFSVASAVARLGESKKLLSILFSMLGVFLFTGVIAAVYMIVVVTFFPPAQGVFVSLSMPANIKSLSFADQFVAIFSVSDFSKLLSHQNMLPLILFSFLTGLAASVAGEKGKAFSLFLEAGTDVFMKVISFIMYYAPIGFFAYFAALVGELGPQILQNYLRAASIYYVAAVIYFLVAFTFYAYLSGKNNIKLFWKNVPVPMLTALATCSSAASIPVNLQAAKSMGVPDDIYETVIPIGTVIHKDGSVLGAIIKIAFLFGLFHLSFSGVSVLLTALVVALMVGTVMGAIPSGGMLGEMLILSLYGFPPQALIIIAAISVVIDPIATVLNVVGNTVCSLLVGRLVKA